MSRKFIIDLTERVLWTFVEAFGATFIASGIDLYNPLHDMSSAKKAAVAALAAAIAAVKALLASQLGNKDSASTAATV